MAILRNFFAVAPNGVAVALVALLAVTGIAAILARQS
jgi:hypothetical protein